MRHFILIWWFIYDLVKLKQKRAIICIFYFSLFIIFSLPNFCYRFSRISNDAIFDSLYTHTFSSINTFYSFYLQRPLYYIHIKRESKNITAYMHCKWINIILLYTYINLCSHPYLVRVYVYSVTQSFWDRTVA